MDTLTQIINLLEEARIQIFFHRIMFVLILGLISSTIEIIVAFVITYLVFNKRFSMFIKPKIIHLIFKNLETNFSLDKYTPTGKYIAKSLYPIFPEKGIYIKEEDVFLLKYQGIPIVMAEIDITKRNKEQTRLYRGIVYQIPKEYISNEAHIIPKKGEEKSTEIITKLEDEHFVYILEKEYKDKFELPLFKKIDSQRLESFCKEIKSKLEFITNYLKTN